MYCASSSLDSDLDSLPFVVDTSDVVELDGEFASLLVEAYGEFNGAAIIETSACHFEVLVPKSLRAAPMWVLTLPEEIAPDLEQLTCQKPSVSQLSSVDLLHRRATIEWTTPTHRICVDVCMVLSSLGWAAENECDIVVALVTPSRTALCTLKVDEDFILHLQIQGMRCDGNYRPVREYSEEKLDVALTRSVLFGNEPVTDDAGAKLVHPVGVQYLYEQPLEW